MKKLLPYLQIGYYVVAALPILSSIYAWYEMRSTEGFAAGQVAGAFALIILFVSISVVALGLILVASLKHQNMPLKGALIALLVAALPVIGFFILWAVK